MSDPVVQTLQERHRKFNWWWPGFVATSLAGAAVMVFRGCWHGNMSWPIAGHGYSYQVCLKCGAMRLFDEKTFRAYGPYRYDIEHLMAWERSAKKHVHAGVDVQH